MKRFLPILFAVSLAHAAGAPSKFVMTDTNGVLALPSTFISSNAAAIAAALPAGSLGTNQLNAQTYGFLTRDILGRELLSDFRARLASCAPSAWTSRRTLASVALIGDSWTATDGFGTVLARRLQLGYGTAGPGWVPITSAVDNNQPYYSSDQSCRTIVDGWTENTGLYFVGNASPNLGALASTNVGDSIVVRLLRGPAATTVQLHYLGAADGGSFRYRWEDGAWTTVDTSLTTGYTVLQLAGVPTTDMWDLKIEVASAGTSGVRLYGTDVRCSSTGVVVHNLGISGATTTTWVTPNGTQWGNALTNLNPSLVIVEVGTNEQLMSVATLTANLSALVSRIQGAVPNAGILLVCVPENETPTNTPMAEVSWAMRNVALSNNVAFLDLQPYFGELFSDYAYGTSKGYFGSDGHHLSYSGMFVNASAILDVIGVEGLDSSGGGLVVSGPGASFGGEYGQEILQNALIDSAATYTLGTGWAYGTNNFVHTTGNTAALSQNITVLNAINYQVSVTISNRTAGSVSIAIGSASKASISATTSFSLKAAAGGVVSFAITPTTDFDGTIENLRVKQITSGVAPFSIVGSFGFRGSESLDNVFVGNGSGIVNTSGNANTAVGDGALGYNTTGYWNTSIGVNTLALNVDGNENLAFGHSALFSNTSGSRNTGIGRSAIYGNTTGTDLVAAGTMAGRYQADGTTALSAAKSSVYLGAYSRGFSNSDNNSVVIAGISGIGEGANTTVIGNTNTTLTHLYGATRIILPSATNGLISGQLWNNAGTVSVMP